ncbi:MAG: cytochrome c [Deltaproteobacteria bacterium]|nr:cytochrome c [Deltaproteobacteria bacterium]
MTFWAKSLLSLGWIGFVLLGLLTAFELLGKKEKRFEPQILRLVHRINGYISFVLFLIISYYCLKIMRGSGQELSPRAALHGVMAVGVFLFLVLKILIIKFYRRFFSMVPILGITVVMLALGTTATSAGYYFAMRGRGSPPGARQEVGGEIVERGAAIFRRHCADCHYTDKRATKIGPGLYGLLKEEKLPSSGRSATVENVRRQIRDPVNVMPPFKNLTEEEIRALTAFIKTL